MTAPDSFRWRSMRRLCPMLAAIGCHAAVAQSGPQPAAAPAAASAEPHAAGHACRAAGGPAERPAIGLVLSGGGARGYAHLGLSLIHI